MLKRLTIIIIVVCFFSRAFSQDNTIGANNKSINTVYIELFGNAGYLYNLTYDRIVFTKGKSNISTGLGAQFFPSSDLASDHIISLSPQVNYFYGHKHYFETGIGVTYDFVSYDMVLPIRIGYRYQKPDGGLFFKVALTPLLTKSYPIFGENLTAIPWGGLSVGWTF